MTVTLLLAPDRVTAPARDDMRACDGVDPEMMFPDDGDGGELPNDHPLVLDAKRVCAGCPIREACLVDAIRRRENFGIWGGLTRKEREALRRRTNRVRARQKSRKAAGAPRTPSTVPMPHRFSIGEQLPLFGAAL